MPELDPIEKHFLDRSLQSNFALWSALLTVNGIMLSGFGLLQVARPKVNPFLVLPLVGSCVISIVLLIINFWVTKQHFLEIGRLFRPEVPDLSNEQRKQDLGLARRKHRNTNRRENAALILLLVEVGLIVFLLVFATVS